MRRHVGLIAELEVLKLEALRCDSQRYELIWFGGWFLSIAEKEA